MRKTALMMLAIGLLATPLSWGGTEYLWTSGRDVLQQFTWDPTTGTATLGGTVTITGGNTFDMEVKDGVMYVAEYNLQKIMMYDPITRAYLGDFANLDFGPSSLAWGPDGNLYVGRFEGTEVQRLDGSTGAYLSSFHVQRSTKRDLEFGADGKLYVSGGGTQIEIYEGPSGTLGNYIDNFTDTELSDVWQLFWTMDGDLLAGDRTGGDDGQGDLFDGSTGAYIRSYDVGGAAHEVHGIAEDGAGHVLCLHESVVGLAMFEADGTYLGLVASPINSEYLMLYAPEPATMGLMLIGGLFGLIRRRK